MDNPVKSNGKKWEGAGRPPKFGKAGKRVNVYLPQHMITFLQQEGNMSGKIQEMVSEKMLEQARDRIDEMNFTDSEKNLIFYDWPNMDDHINWLLTASRDEIAEWLL